MRFYSGPCVIGARPNQAILKLELEDAEGLLDFFESVMLARYFAPESPTAARYYRLSRELRAFLEEASP